MSGPVSLPAGLVAALLALAPATGARTAPAPDDSLLAAVPADALAVLTAADVGSLVRDLKLSSWGNLWFDEQLAPLRDWLLADADGELGEMIGGLEDVPVSTLLASVQGSVVAYVAGASGDALVAGLLVDPGEGRADFRRALDALRTAALERGARVRLHRGVELVSWTTDAGEGIGFFTVGGTTTVLMVSDGEALAQRALEALARAQGVAGPGIAETELFREATADGATARVRLFVDTYRTGAALADTELTERERDIFRTLGLPGVRWISATFDAAGGEELDVLVRIDRPRAGWVANVLELTGPAPVGLSRLGPQETVQATLGHFDVSGFFDAVTDLALALDTESDPEEQLEVVKQATGLDLRADFIDVLTGDFAAFCVPVSEEEWRGSVYGAAYPYAGAATAAMEGEPEDLWTGTAYVLGVEDPETVAFFAEEAVSALELLSGLGPLEVEEQDVGGTTLYTLALERGEVDTAAAWALGEDYVAFSLFPSAVRAILALDRSGRAWSLRESPTFASHLENYTSATYLSMASTPRAVRSLISSLEWIQGLGPAMSEDPMPLPVPDVVELYLEGTLITLVTVEDDSVVFSMLAR